MKKFLMIAAMAVCSLAASAQIYVGGSLGAGMEKVKDGETTTAITIAPEVGYQLSDNMAVGVELGYDFLKYKEADTKATQLSVGAYLRYDFAELSDNAKIFADVYAGYGSVKVDDADAIGGFKVALRPGVKFALSESCDLIAKMDLVSYEKYKKDDYELQTTTFKFMPSSVSLGVAFKF